VGPRLLQARGRPDLVEAALDLVPAHRPLRHQFAVEVREVGGPVGRDALHGRAAQQGHAVIDVAHLGAGVVLVVAQQSPVAEEDVAPVPAVLVAQHRHERGLGTAQEVGQHGLVVDVEIGVAVHHEALLAEQRQGVPQGATRPSR